MLWVIQCFFEGDVPSPRGLHPKTTALRHHFCGIPLTTASLSQPFSNMKALSKTLALWWVRVCGGGGVGRQFSMRGLMAQAHCHCWQEEESGELGGDTECESWCDWFQIEEQGEGPSFVWPYPFTQPNLLVRGPQLCNPAGQWSPCRRNGCDYRPEGVFFFWRGVSLCLCANYEALIMIIAPLHSQMSLSLSL